MAKRNGLGANLYVGGYDLSGDVGAVNQIAGPQTLLDVTAINASGHERIGGVRGGNVDFMAFYNTDSGQAHPVLSALPTTDVDVMACIGTTLGDAAAACRAKQVGYDGTRAADGSYTFTTTAQATGYGVEWGKLVTAGKRTDTEATAGTGVDFTAAGTFGLQAWLQVFDFDGDDITIKLQESSDNGTDPWADVTGGAFTEVTAGPGTQRIATATNLAVERYLRVTTTTSAGFTTCTFAVMVNVNRTAPVF